MVVAEQEHLHSIVCDQDLAEILQAEAAWQVRWGIIGCEHEWHM
jgi:hypothetical protein